MTTRQHSDTAPNSPTQHPDALGSATDFSFHLRGGPALHDRPGLAEGIRSRALTMPIAMKTAVTAGSLPRSHADVRQHPVRVTVARRADRHHTAKES
ncbi:hypothetical protein ACF1BP_23815 [Streptomyces sp. NPDC014735]|uniref:hypothetical protein n=1 Tax=Streptomyces sp. NPDC014735 TaxID=3364887 RepID=UPI0036F6ADC2